jgi:cellulose synthase/poly-beta-1,6-N-acetylglucosamine synthase-like glycosyltransferase
MEFLLTLVLLIGLVLCSLYLLLIASYCFAWIKMKEERLISDVSVFVSVIVAARNEEENIARCIDAVLAQNYPSEMFELIIVDDHSEDATFKIATEYAKKFHQIKCVQLQADLIGKKKAVTHAISIAKGKLIVTTDADCEMEINWLASFVSFYVKTNAKVIVAPVAFRKENSLFEKMQSLEFMALMACGGASLYYSKAIMCNGANLCYLKEVFNEVGGYSTTDEKASGDDVLLMYKIKKSYPEGVLFLKSKEAIVYTKAVNTIKAFFQQRKRWASKGFLALNKETKAVALLIYLFNLYLLCAPLLGSICFKNSAVYPLYIEICLILFGIKCFIDFLLLFLSASFFHKKRFLLLFIPEQIIYMIYVVLFGFIGSVGKYEWKGRKTN